MESNFEFLKLDTCTAQLFATVNMAEQNYLIQDYNGVLVNCRKVAEAIVKMVLDREGTVGAENFAFNELLKSAKPYITDSTILDALYKIKKNGNIAAHEIDSLAASSENAITILKNLYDVLVWFVHYYLDSEIQLSALHFMEPQARSRYKAAERKFIYIQSVPNKDGLWNAYEGAHKIGEGTAPEEELEADWRPNSEFLRSIAPKRINQYMKTSGVPFSLGWVELAFNSKTKEWFHDYDVHNVLIRSGIKHAEHLEGNEWFSVDLDTAKLAIKAVKNCQASLKDSPVKTLENKIILRPEQIDAITQTKAVFKKKKEMLWNAKMRFGKTLTTLQLIKEMSYKRVLIMTHRPVVADSWFDDFLKMDMKNSGYSYGSLDRGEHLESLKSGNSPYIYFASIQYLRYGNGTINLDRFAEVEWDLIVVDEAHEGTQTDLSDIVFNALIKDETRLLFLSGTPFNLLNQYEDSQVYTWDYTMEQSAKLKWALEHPGIPNPYEKLPKVNMYTFEMKQAPKFTDETRSFNFREFFRTDSQGKFVYQTEVNNFLDNITNENDKSKYPFSTKQYRDELRHTLWILPGIKEANALEGCLREHPVLGREYTIVNVVSDLSADDGQTSDDDLDKVRQAIGKDPSQSKTITLTVRRLTTGVNIPEWTAVIFLSNTNSAMGYLQAAFRAQTPFSHEKLGMKQNCYIFDFAPDRALTVMAESAQINSGVGKKNTQEQRDAMVRLLNFMPVLGQTDTGMKPYDVDRMLTQLKRVYAEKAVRSGFEDDSLYSDALLMISEDDANAFNELRGIVGKTNKQKTEPVKVNENGLTEEEYSQAESARKKSKIERTAEEQEAIEKVKELKKQRRNLISILRGVSIRIPMMIYGMPVELDVDITIDKFINLVDDQSWEEFMPKGFTKGMFKRFTKYYDAEVFIEAGRIIRRRAKSYDKLDYIERAEQIAMLFSVFKNPDKETILTPWRVINMQFGDMIGGLNFYDDTYENSSTDAISNMHWIDQEDTDNLYTDGINFLDINSKTGLYPLYIAISLYYKKMQENSKFNPNEIYKEILNNQVYAIAKTPMAKTITKRTLTGYKDLDTNIVYIPSITKLIQQNIGKESVKKVFNDMKFDVIIGNPPYTETDKNSSSGSGTPLYDKFIDLAISLNPKYISLITPSVWFQGGKGLDDFRSRMLSNVHFKRFHNYITPNDVFPDVNLRGGVNYFLWDRNWNNSKDGIEVKTYKNGDLIEEGRRGFSINGVDLFIADNSSFNLLNKLIQNGAIDVNYISNEKMLYDLISERNPFGIPTTVKQFRKKSEKDNIKVYASKGQTGYVSSLDIKKNYSWIDKYKVLTAFANNISTDLPDDNLNTIISEPYSVATETYLVIGAALDLSKAEAINLSKYLKTKFVKFLISLAKANQNGTRKTYRFVPRQNFTSDSDLNWDLPLDIQLYSKYQLTENEISLIESRIS